MKPLNKMAAAVGIIAAGAVWLLVSTPPSPIALIRVVDTSGKPIPGALIKPDGLRPKNNGGHYFWSDRFEVKPTPVTTDSSGVGRVPYPHFVTEHLETGEISFAVEHPDFCSDRPFRVVSAAPPANAPITKKFEFYVRYALALITRKVSVRPDPVVLQRGGTVEVSGYKGSKESPISAFVPMTSANTFPAPGFWKEKGRGVLTSSRIPAGITQLRLVHFSENGQPWFSDFMSFDVKVGETNRIDLELKPGSTITGKLEDSVPRPVTNGVVVAEIAPADVAAQSSPPVWHVSSPIKPDGSFTLDSVPRGRLEIVAVCDGFLSRNGPSQRQNNQRKPQRFAIDKPSCDVVLEMEPGASCEILVLDDRGQRLEGASVSFWPNVLWNDYGSTIFASDLYDTTEVLKAEGHFDWWAPSRPKNRYTARSDKHGVALVRDLPENPGGESFDVSHPAFEMPVKRAASGDAYRYDHVSLDAGRTNQVTVRLQKKGTQFVEH